MITDEDTENRLKDAYYRPRIPTEAKTVWIRTLLSV
jgi:hypothetical protein